MCSCLTIEGREGIDATLIIIEEGITNIGKNAFNGITNVKEIVLK